MGWLKKHNFLIRKIHSLLGLGPIGLFLIEHLITNSFARQGIDVYNEKIEWIQGLPYLLLMEIGLIFVPLILHVVLGIVFLWAWQDNSIRYPYARNRLYALQRVTGMIAFFFIGYHVWQFRIATEIYDLPVNFQLVSDAMTNKVVFGFYLLGIAASVFHFANGVWSFLVHWGITVGPKSQQISGYICAGVGALLLYIGFDALFAFI